MNTIPNRIAIVGIILILSAPSVASVGFPDHWTKYPGNPISTDFLGTTVIFHEGTYKAWGEADDGVDYATSPDCLVWTVHPASPVLVKGPEWYDQEEISVPSVVIVDTTYHMFYSGKAAGGDNRIAHATSLDGIEWTKDGANPVMDLGPTGSRDDQEVMHPFVLYEEPRFCMWYNGASSVGSQCILYAESFDGVSWTRNPVPVLEAGPPGDWDDSGLAMMNVVPYQGTYYMFYTGGNEVDGQVETIQIGCATSPDGVNWIKRIPSVPVLSPGNTGDWDDYAVVVPVVLIMESGIRMYYGGTRNLDSFSWGIATPRSPGAVPDIIRIQLGQNTPNPFNPQTTIAFDLPSEQPVSLRVYDVAGRLVDILLHDEIASQGRNEVAWRGIDLEGRTVPAGVYIYRLEAGSYSETKRMVLVK